MRIGYFVQGWMDEAFVKGLARRWCPDAKMERGQFRGRSGESLRREIKKTLLDLFENRACEVLIVVTDCDVAEWREIKRAEFEKVPDQLRAFTAFGVTDRNIESWLTLDRIYFAKETGCSPLEIPKWDPSGFVKKVMNRGMHGKEDTKERVINFVAGAVLRTWINNSDSFEDFYEQCRDLAQEKKCAFPNEREKRI